MRTGASPLRPQDLSLSRQSDLLRGGVAAPVTSAPESALRLRPRSAVSSAQVTAS